MSSRQREWADHIAQNIARIFEYVGEPPDPERLEQPMVRDAVERCLERISEAVSRLHRAEVPLQALEPDVPWTDIRGFGNVVRHDYDGVDPDVVRETLLSDLPPLRAAALRLKAKL